MLTDEGDMENCVAAEENPLYVASQSVCSDINGSGLRIKLPFKRLHV
jgi:hypothetical protein